MTKGVELDEMTPKLEGIQVQFDDGNRAKQLAKHQEVINRQMALCVKANPALASHRVDSKMRSSPSEPASGSWVSAWQLAETVVAAWQGALTTAAAAVVAAVAVASCVGCDGQRSTSQTCRALKASAASKLRLSTQCCYTVLLTILLSTLPASLAAR